MYISVGASRYLLVARKENLTGVSTGRESRPDQLVNPTGFRLCCIVLTVDFLTKINLNLKSEVSTVCG